MTDFVLDASVTLRWTGGIGTDSDLQYARAVVSTMDELQRALVPTLWHTEVISVLLAMEQRNEIDRTNTERFLSTLEGLPISTDTLTSSQAFRRTISLARTYRLTGYDAAYLELATRYRIPLATLDKKLRKAADKAEVEVYLVRSTK